MNISAPDKAQLLEILGRIDISVPPRGPERTNDHIERWAIARLLATLASSDGLAYPLSSEKRERPDYLVIQNSKLTGFELTEAINPQYVQAQSLPEATEKSNIVDAGHFKWGEEHSLENLRNISSREHLTAPPWMGSDVEQEYAQMIIDITLKKTTKLNKPSFAKYAENNLVIYVNQMLPILETQEATALCGAGLVSCWGETCFDNIYVECHSEIHRYSETGVAIIPLNNLWQ